MQTLRVLVSLSLLVAGVSAWALPIDNAGLCKELGDEWLMGQGAESASCSFAKRIAACEAEHGNWRRIGKAGYPACIHTSRDAGKACSDAADCQFGCDAGMQNPATSGQVVGKCSVNDDRFGCHAWVEHGHVKEALCVD